MAWELTWEWKLNFIPVSNFHHTYKIFWNFAVLAKDKYRHYPVLFLIMALQEQQLVQRKPRRMETRKKKDIGRPWREDSDSWMLI